MKHHLALLALGILALAGSGCATAGAGVDSVAVACSVGAGATRFPLSYLDGPTLDRHAFAASASGRTLEAFFTAGPGVGENEHYLAAEGFSVLADSTVLGYRDDVPFAVFALDDGRVEGWGDCRPNLVRGDLTARRWYPVRPMDREAVRLPLVVEGEGCANADGGVEVITEIGSVDVVETDDSVRIIAWTRERHGLLDGLLDVLRATDCAGVGAGMDAAAFLAAPLGERELFDGGTIPATPIGRGEPATDDSQADQPR